MTDSLRGATRVYKAFHEARLAAGRPDLRLHDLRHTGSTLAAAAGATTAELMARNGHATADMAMHYQHVIEERAKEIAQRLSEIHDADVVELRPQKRRRAAK